jgi:hypothetical protein
MNQLIRAHPAQLFDSAQRPANLDLHRLYTAESEVQAAVVYG